MEFDYKKYLKENKLNIENEETNPDFIEISADWKDFEGFVDMLEKELPKLGLYIIEHPLDEGSDQVGVIISKHPIDPDKFMRDNYQDLYNDELEGEEDTKPHPFDV